MPFPSGEGCHVPPLDSSPFAYVAISTWSNKLDLVKELDLIFVFLIKKCLIKMDMHEMLLDDGFYIDVL